MKTAVAGVVYVGLAQAVLLAQVNPGALRASSLPRT